MEKVQGNYLSQSSMDFPLDCETLNYIQQNQKMCEVLGNIAGDKTILYGCTPNSSGTEVGAGYVFLKTVDYPEGEVIYWEGGSITNGVYVKKTDIAVEANGKTYSKAYTKRTLAPGNTGTERYSWGDFSKIATSEPLGTIHMFAGASAPDGYHLCDGAELNINDYPALYAAIGDTFNTAPNPDGTSHTTASGKFRLPDLSGRFVVGYKNDDTDYNVIGKAGGEKKHKLTDEEYVLKSHTHTASASGGEHTHIYKELKNSSAGGDRFLNVLAGDYKYDKEDTTIQSSGGHTHTVTVANAGADVSTAQAHENRPPYYVLAYIMKLK